MRFKLKQLLSLAALFALLVTGCGGSGGGSKAPPETPADTSGSGAVVTPPIATITITPDSASIEPGHIATFTAVAKDASGSTVTGKTFSWISSDTAIATIGTDGVATGIVAGVATVQAGAEGVQSNTATLTVQNPVVGGSSSSDLIAAALAAGEIDAETALTYRVFSEFGDARLPAKYKGNDVEEMESAIVDEINENYDTLSDAAKAALKPFLLRPSDEGSWLNMAASSASVAKRGIAYSISRPNCGPTFYRWKFIDTPTAKVRVWYDETMANGLSQANFVANEVESVIWPTLITGLHLKEPASDALNGLGVCQGGNGRLDMYIVNGLEDRGQAWDEGGTMFTSPTYILLKSTLSNAVMRQTVAHELMHAIHWSYETKASQKSYGWFRDAIANWGVDQVYPPNALYSPPRYITSLFEQASCQFRSPYISLDDRSPGYCAPTPSINRDYGAYLPLQFIGKTIDPLTVVQILERTEGSSGFATAYEAIDAVVPGGFEKFWPKYARALWNQEPVKSQAKSFKSWDDLDDKPIITKKEWASLQAGQPYAETELDDRVDNVAIKYYQFNFYNSSQYDPTGADPNKPMPPTDDKTHSLMFHNTFYDNKVNNQKVSVYAMYKPENLPWVEEDWSSHEWIGLCRDKKIERVQQLVIIISSAETTGTNPKVVASAKPKFMRNNIGCWGFKGTATATYNEKNWTQGGLRKVTVNVTYDAHPSATYTGENRLRVPISGPLFREAAWRVEENYTDEGGCHYSAFGTGTGAQGPTSSGNMLINYFDRESLPPDIRNDLPQVIGVKERAYFMAGATNDFVTGNITRCPPPSPDSPPPDDSTYDTPVGLWLLTHAEPPQAPLAADDGHLRAIWISSMPEDFFVQKYDWDLEPIREP